ncbi:MAG: erythromycin esterase family protein, partial [Chloroflexota bacterium]
MTLPFHDRRDAGRRLADRLATYRGNPDLIVLGLPRGGVPVAAETAEALGAPLDALLVRKRGLPRHEEWAMGAIASGGVRVLKREGIAQAGISDAVIASVEARERLELSRRERLYRGSRPAPDVAGRTVLLVDDGLATGSTMRAAAEALRLLGPARIAIAAPVGSRSVCAMLREVADEVICAETPEPFYAVGAWYEEFGPTTDEEVQAALRAAEDRSARVSAAREQPPIRRPADSRGNCETDAIRLSARPLPGGADDYDDLLADVGTARFVLIGEASHGTREFYRERIRVTRRLIEEHGFDAVAVEADWPDAWRVNRYVRGIGDDATPVEALGDFHRFPRWMWRNTEVAEFVGWLRSWNDALPPAARKTGIYGLDLYSMHASREAVVRYLDWVDPDAARRARARYACFDHFGPDPQSYGYLTPIGGAESCENEAVGQLVDMLRSAGAHRSDGPGDADEHFFATQNARLVRNAEGYYRAMYHGRIPSWNLRDRHMAETLEALSFHLALPDRPARFVVWAHNSHLGDARATSMAAEGELNLGQLVRERHAADSRLVGFTSFAGTVGPGAPQHVDQLADGLVLAGLCAADSG